MDETTLEEIEIIIRDFNPSEDEAYIYASWRNSSFYSSCKEEVHPQLFFSLKNKQINRILKEANIRIACFKDTQSVIVGYCVSTETHLDFIYVKDTFRKKGVGTLLMPKNIETVTKDLTKIGKIIKEKKNLRFQGELDGRTEDRSQDQGIQNSISIR